MWTKLMLACFVWLMAGVAHAGCGNGKPVRLAGLDWESGQISTAIIDRILRDGYGCATEIVPGSTTTVETALMQDDIQLIAEQWVGRSEVMAKAEREGKVAVVGDTLKGGGGAGLVRARLRAAGLS